MTPQRDLGFDRIAERIYKFPEVTAVYLISGAYDFLIILEGKTLKEASRFVSEKLSPIEPVLSTATHFILKKYKDHGTILAPQKKAESTGDAVMKNPLSDKIVNIQPSGIRKFFDIVNEMKDAISLGVGEPDFDTPWRIREEGIYLWSEGGLSIPPTQG